MMRLAMAGTSLIASQGHLAEGKVMRFEKPADPTQQWIEQRIDVRPYPHGLAVLASGKVEVSPAPIHTLIAIGNDVIAVGPNSIRYLRR
jgi:hypothetical protein